MEMNILTRLPHSVDAAALAERLHIDGALRDEFDDVFNEAVAAANPKVIYGRAPVERMEGAEVRVGGMLFRSKILHVNMENVQTAYPYVATCGRELHELAMSKGDVLERYWVESIAEHILHGGLQSALAAIRDTEGTGTLYAMNPGSLADWPISQQRPLFALLGDVMRDIGVELTESFLMMPIKSVSGLLFESERHYTNCSLCPRDGCPNRREPYNQELLSEKYLTDDVM